MIKTDQKNKPCFKINRVKKLHIYNCIYKNKWKPMIIGISKNPTYKKRIIMNITNSIYEHLNILRTLKMKRLYNALFFFTYKHNSQRLVVWQLTNFDPKAKSFRRENTYKLFTLEKFTTFSTNFTSMVFLDLITYNSQNRIYCS